MNKYAQKIDLKKHYSVDHFMESMDLYNAGDYVGALKMFIVQLEKDKNNSEHLDMLEECMKKVFINKYGVQLTEFIDWLIKEADTGNSSSQAILGLFYEKGCDIIKKDSSAAFKLYKLSADQQNILGTIYLGNAYYSGLEGFMAVDNNKAFSLYTSASIMGMKSESEY